ncbi:MAG: hypothetical protein RR382_00645 [Tannerellaceae bacterium]
MKVKLEALGLPYELVHGEKPDLKDVKFSEVRGCNFVHDRGDGSYIAGVAGCRRGTLAAIEKGLYDNPEDGFIFCNDDIKFNEDTVKLIKEGIDNLPTDVGMLGMCTNEFHRARIDAIEGLYSRANEDYCRFEWMCYLRPWFAWYYIEAIKSLPLESDRCIQEYRKQHGYPEVYILNKSAAEYDNEAQAEAHLHYKS